MADNEKPAKRRRLKGSCDLCRKRKIRCDSAQVPGKCTNCLAGGHECTHVELTKNLGSAKGYVENLEQRLEKMERLLKSLGVDVPEASEEPDVDISKLGDNSGDLPRNDNDDILGLQVKVQNMSIGQPVSKPFFGRSSGIHLVDTAVRHKLVYTGEGMENAQQDLIIGCKREDYWNPVWPKPSVDPTAIPHDFPAQTLSAHLIDKFFQHLNPGMPLLHRPSLEKSINAGLHLINPSFAHLYLMVCAVGSRYTDDPSVLYQTSQAGPSSAGLQWYMQVPPLTAEHSPSLYTMQTAVLTLMFRDMIGDSADYWISIGIALRMAQSVGAHRRKRHGPPTVEDELWKRVFWVLLCIDRLYAAFKGRPLAMSFEEFDLDLPVDCDDEYWECPDPSMNFKQPPGKPSRISFFIHYLRLMDIVAYTIKTVYAVNKPASISGRPLYKSEQEIVSELDSEMNGFLESLPPHLRWDPERADELFFYQSALLHICYHHVQIFIHKPFMPSPGVPATMSYPSLTICVNAARSCAHFTRLLARGGSIPLFEGHLLPAVFSASVVLLLNTWYGQTSGAPSNAISDLEDAHSCMAILKALEIRNCGAGRFWDLVTELATVRRNLRPSVSHYKRGREENGPSTDANVVGQPSNEPRNVAGSRRVQQQQQRSPATLRAQDFTFRPTGVPTYGSFSPPTLHQKDLTSGSESYSDTSSPDSFQWLASDFSDPLNLGTMPTPITSGLDGKSFSPDFPPAGDSMWGTAAFEQVQRFLQPQSVDQQQPFSAQEWETFLNDLANNWTDSQNPPYVVSGVTQ